MPASVHQLLRRFVDEAQMGQRPDAFTYDPEARRWQSIAGLVGQLLHERDGLVRDLKRLGRPAVFDTGGQE